MKIPSQAFLAVILVSVACFMLSCSSIPQELPRDPNEKAEGQRLPLNRTIAADDSLITYCSTETAAAATPEEKKWRDAFSLEVMERICNQDPVVAKPWRNSTYLESSWAYGLNLTGVDSGVPRGTAITPRHVIYTKHYGFHGQVGQNIWFLTLDNRWVTRKIIEVKYLDNADVAIARLESDLPGSITPLRVLDPQAFNLVPDLVPLLRIEQQSKALLVDKRGYSLGMPGGVFGTVLSNPPERAFAQYYQNMVRFDSSSPTLLLLRNEYGVMPILYSLVTFANVGTGPQVHQLVTEIQATIASFGDSHQLQKAMPPVTPVAAPSCSISVVRASDGHSCNLTVKASADPVTGNPAVSPVAPVTWTAQRNTWTGSVECPSDPNTIFEATLSGPGGTGRTCESGAIGPALPQCSVAVSRRGSSEVCDVSVTKLTGNPDNAPVLSPNNPSDWARSGNTWSGTTSCALSTTTSYSAQLTDEVGTGPACKTALPVYSEIPTCELSAQRVGYTDSCQVIVTRKSGVVSGNPSVFPQSPSSWTRNGDRYTGTVTCSTESISTFSASLTGPLGSGPVCKSASILSVPVEIPFCEMTATRQGLTNVCKLQVNHTRGWIVYGPPVASPRNPADWKNITRTNNFEGTALCAYNGPTVFSAYLPGHQNFPGRVCQAPSVDKIPAPSCNLQVSRQTTTNKCNYTLSAGSVAGTIASYALNGSTTRVAWNGSTPLSSEFACSQIADTPVSVSVWGPGANPQSGTCRAVVPKLPPPNCQLTAQRRNRMSVCDLSLTNSGIIDTSKRARLSPSGTWTSWSGTSARGSGSCAVNKATTFTATVYGPGGSQFTCSSNTVPRL